MFQHDQPPRWKKKKKEVKKKRKEAITQNRLSGMMNNFVASTLRDWIILFILKGNGIAFRGCKSKEHVITVRSCAYLQCTTRGLWAWRSFSWRWLCTSDKNVRRSDGEWGTPLKNKKIKTLLSINQTMTWFELDWNEHRMEPRVHGHSLPTTHRKVSLPLI